MPPVFVPCLFFATAANAGCGDGTTPCRWRSGGDLIMREDGVVVPKPLGSREHVLFSSKAIGRPDSSARRGALLLHGAARTFVLPLLHHSLRHFVIETLTTHLGAPCDVFAAVSMYDPRTTQRNGRFRTAKRDELVAALNALVPTGWAPRRMTTLSWSVLDFKCASPAVRMDSACTRLNKRAQFKHTPTMIIQATQIEAALGLLRSVAWRSVAVEYDWVLRARPDMQWLAAPDWAALLADRRPVLYAAGSGYTLCTDCVMLLPSERAEELLSPKSRVVCGSPDGSIVGSGHGPGTPEWERRGPRTACCNHFEGFNSQCVLNGTHARNAVFPAVLRRAAQQYLQQVRRTILLAAYLSL